MCGSSHTRSYVAAAKAAFEKNFTRSGHWGRYAVKLRVDGVWRPIVVATPRRVVVRLQRGTTSLRWDKCLKQVDRFKYGVGSRLFSRHVPEMRELLVYYSLRSLARMVSPPCLVTRRDRQKGWAPATTRQKSTQKANWVRRIVEIKTAGLVRPHQVQRAESVCGSVADESTQTTNVDSSPLIEPASTVMRSSLITTITQDPNYVRDLMFVALAQVSRMPGSDVIAARARLGLLGQDAVSYAKSVLPLIPHLGDMETIITESAVSSSAGSSSVISHPSPHIPRITTKLCTPKVWAEPRFLPSTVCDEEGIPLSSHKASRASAVHTYTFRCGCVLERSLVWSVAPDPPSSPLEWASRSGSPCKMVFASTPGRPPSYRFGELDVTEANLLACYGSSRAVDYKPAASVTVSVIDCGSKVCLRSAIGKLTSLLVG